MDKSVEVIGFMGPGFGGVNRHLIKYINNNAREVFFVILSTRGVNSDHLKEIKAQYTIATIPGIKHPFLQYKCLKKIYKDYNVKSLYLNVSSNLTVIPLIVAKICGVPKRIIHAHSSNISDSNFFRRFLLVCINNVLKFFPRRYATEKLACSDKAAEWIFGKNQTYVFIKNGVDKSKFSFSKEIRIELRKQLKVENCFCIGFLGMFVYAKNVFWFIKLAKKLLRTRKNFRIIMLGDGQYFEKFKKIINQKELSDYFILLGNKSDAYKYYNCFDCFVLPSRFEGLPFVAIEAQVNGLPCLLSNKITQQAKIIEQCDFFSLSNVSKVSTLINNINYSEEYRYEIKVLENFSDFVF